MRVGVRVGRAAGTAGIAIAALLVSGVPGPRAAEPAAGESVERRLEALEKAVAELRAELQRLRSERPGATEAPAPEAIRSLEAKIDALTEEIERLRIGAAAAPAPARGTPAGGYGPAAGKVYAAKPGVSIGGYGQMLYQNFDQTADDGSRSSAIDPGFEKDTVDLERAVLYFGYKFDDRFLFNSEIEFEHAVAGEGEPGEVEIEFAYVDWRAAKSFGVRGGILLVPLGFINELHEPPIFHGATRPEVEQRIIPTTWRENGIGAYGEAGIVSWRAALMAGLDASGFESDIWIREGRQEGAQSVAVDLAVTARVDVTPKPGLLFGASAYSGDSGQGDPALGDAHVLLWDAHAQWDMRGWHFRGLYARGTLGGAARVSRQVGEPIGSLAAGYYAEAACDLLRGRGAASLSPFVRYEALDTQKRVEPDSTGGADPANDRTVRTLGITFRPIPNVAVKLDHQDFGNAAGTGVDRWNFALGYLF